jgi:hypothetical protein
MNWNISRNYEKRLDLHNKIKALEKEREKKIDALSDSLPDAEYDAALDRIFSEWEEESRKLEKLEMALEYKEAKNDWFSSFVHSFPVCESRKVSPKQAAIFAKYSEQAHERKNGRGLDYFVRVGGLFIETTVFPGMEGGYITITEL